MFHKHLFSAIFSLEKVFIVVVLGILGRIYQNEKFALVHVFAHNSKSILLQSASFSHTGTHMIVQCGMLCLNSLKGLLYLVIHCFWFEKRNPEIICLASFCTLPNKITISSGGKNKKWPPIVLEKETIHHVLKNCQDLPRY